MDLLILLVIVLSGTLPCNHCIFLVDELIDIVLLESFQVRLPRFAIFFIVPISTAVGIVVGRGMGCIAHIGIELFEGRFGHVIERRMKIVG